MEARKITIVSTKTQKKSVVMSGAETLAELKQDLRAAGIDFEDMAFYEGTSKTELKVDSSFLPKDVPYTNRTTGETHTTNELVFMLTNTNKKIRSGAMSAERVAAYNAITDLNLKQAVLARFGKNYTQVSTADLVAFVEEHNTTEAPAEVGCYCAEAIEILTDILYYNDYISEEEKETVLGALNASTALPGLRSSYSDDEINAMFADMH